MRKTLLKLIMSLCLVLTFFVSSLPGTSATVSAKHNHTNWWDNSKDNWDPTKDNSTPSKYLVLIGQSNGTYTAYNDIAFLQSKYVMVKAKPLASALGLSYVNYAGWYKKGCTISLDKDMNVYYRNKKTYYFYDYNSSNWQTTCTKKTAQYKQMVYQNYNAIHCATLGNLVNYQYYDTAGIWSYSSLGYCGVVVYNRYNSIYSLPDISYVTNLNGGNSPANPNPNTSNVTIKPVTTTDSAFSDIKYVEATYTTQQTDVTQLLDLSEVLTAFYYYGLPNDGIYGYGNCDSVITIQGIDAYGNSVGDIKTNGNEFLLNFPKAVKLKITGTQKNLLLDFTPVKPIVITDNAKLAFSQISWLFPSDRYARQYFVISEHLRFRPEGIASSYTSSRKMLTINNNDNPDNANSYQRITAVFKSPYNELVSPYCYINVQKSGTGINNSLVVFSDTGNAILAPDYEAKLVSMISSLNTVGSNNYYPSKNWNRQLVMKLSDNTANTTYNYITIDASALNLDHFYDYYLHLHEMTHFYEATTLHYGFRFEAWTEGNATTLAKKTMDKLSVSYKDATGKDYFDLMYKTDFSFLTQDNKNNFESYYLNASGWNATVIGYHFTKFLQDMYGSDIVYRILDKVYAANIPTWAGRNSTYDKQFTDCIKSATSQNVFNLFVEYYVN